MSRRTPQNQPPKVGFLGIEGGATRSTAVLVDAEERPLGEFHGPPANIKLMSEKRLLEVFEFYKRQLPPVPLAGIGVGFAGVRTDGDRGRILEAVRRIWTGVPCYATNDLETALETAPEVKGTHARVLILAGTGSCCFGVNRDLARVTVGGRGHVVGDRGSAYDISQQAMRAVMADLDRRGKWPPLGQEILRALCLNDVEELIAWSLQADKTAIASLATAVFARANRGDRMATSLLRTAAASLAEDALRCASRLAGSGEPVQFVLNGGVLLHNPRLVRMVARFLRRQRPTCRITPVERASCWGAARLARARTAARATPPPEQALMPPAPHFLVIPGPETLQSSPTEKRNPRSMLLDRMSVPAAIDLMLREEGAVARKLLAHRRTLSWAVRKIAHAFENGGRLIYVGAGTSGRLGVLDASECPPTFRSSGDQVQAIIAGGPTALWNAVEGAEDDTEAGARAVQHRGVGTHDFVVGIAASGRTPFVWAALAEAARRGAKTLLVCFNPAVARFLVAPTAFRPERILAVNLGPEVLTGSTRLKCGTATKLVFNLFTTLAFVRTGKVMENLMVDVNPSNAKLRDRAVRILAALEKCPLETARDLLVSHHWSIAEARKAIRAKTKRRD